MNRLVILAAFMAALTQPGDENTVPRTEGKTLSERKIVLADELRGKEALLIVTFSRAAGSAAQEWTRHIQEKKLLKPGMSLYQVSMLEEVPRLLRGMVIGGIRKGVPAEKHAEFVVLVKDQNAWKKAVHHSHDDDPYLMRVNAAGVIQWRMVGRLTEARSQELAAQLK